MEIPIPQQKKSENTHLRETGKSGAYLVADYPGGTPSNLTTSNQYWANFPGTNEKAEIWQYEGNPDLDVARILS